MVINIQKNTFNEVKFQLPIKNNFISVIIPVYKDAKGLHDTLTSLQKQTIDKSLYEVIVANDGDDAEISNICIEFKVKEVKITPNKGSYSARNRAIEQSKGEFLAFTDADVKLPDEWLKKGKTALNEEDYLGGPILFPVKKKYNFEEKFAQLYEFNIRDSYEREHFFVTANLFTKRLVIETIGGFDGRLYSGGDTEFGNRVYISKLFSQKYFESICVVHPYRNYKEIIKKKIRITQGLAKLIEYYPERFKHLKPTYFDDIIVTVIPPFNYINDIKFFFFFFGLNILVAVYKYKYIKSMNFFMDGSRINRLFNLFKN